MKSPYLFLTPVSLYLYKMANSPVPPTYLEQKRHEAQMQYREEQAYIAANKANFDKLIKDEQDALAQQMPGTFWGAAAAIMGGAPPGAPQPGQPGQDAAAGQSQAGAKPSA